MIGTPHRQIQELRAKAQPDAGARVLRSAVQRSIAIAWGVYQGSGTRQGEASMLSIVRCVAMVLTMVVLTGRAANASEFKLDDLPRYQIREAVSGTIRNFGFGLGGVLKLWEDDFRKIHPGIRFDDKLPTSDAAIPALVTRCRGSRTGRRRGDTHRKPLVLRGLRLSRHRYRRRLRGLRRRRQIQRPVIFVHQDNPITKLTIKQLDGIFGAERTAGMRGFEWTPSDGRERRAEPPHLGAAWTHRRVGGQGDPDLRSRTVRDHAILPMESATERRQVESQLSRICRNRQQDDRIGRSHGSSASACVRC